MNQLKPLREVVTHDRAAAMDQAARDLGDIIVRPLAHEGQEYVHDTMPLTLAHPEQLQFPEKSFSGIVPTGHVYTETTLGETHSTADELLKRADELQARLPTGDSRAA